MYIIYINAPDDLLIVDILDDKEELLKQFNKLKEMHPHINYTWVNTKNKINNAS